MNDGTKRCAHGKLAEPTPAPDVGPGYLRDLADCANCERDLFEPLPYLDPGLTQHDYIDPVAEATKLVAELNTSEHIPGQNDPPFRIEGGAASKATTTNPKDLVGSRKVSVTKLPPVAVIHGSRAMMDGARKYGPYNWREKDVVAHIYLDAALRHLYAWFEGEELAQDSGVHHLGHAIACCAILLDAQTNGNLIDDRPITERSRGVATRLLEALQLPKEAP